MIHCFRMPQLGLTMTEGEVVAWLKAEGDRVERGEPLVTVETDKIANDVEAPLAYGPVQDRAAGLSLSVDTGAVSDE